MTWKETQEKIGEADPGPRTEERGTDTSLRSAEGGATPEITEEQEADLEKDTEGGAGADLWRREDAGREAGQGPVIGESDPNSSVIIKVDDAQ